MKIRPWLGIVLAATLGGCALSPQTVAIKPLIDARSYPIGRGRSLALEVVDQRPVAHFGTRGGLYDTAFISPRTEVAPVIRQALAERLGADGFKVTLDQASAPLAIRVEIQRIDYIASGDPMKKEVRVEAAIRAVTRNGGRTLTSQYRASKTHQVLTPPDEVENEAIINEVVAEALRRLLQDGALLDLLGQ